MKSLKQLRQEKGLTLIDVEYQSNINSVQLNEFETGKHIPGATIRKKLERFYGEKINFLDTPIKVAPREPAADYNDCEREFRYLLKMIASMPPDELESFCKTSSYHLNQIFKNINE